MDALDHISHLKVRASLWAKVLWLGAVIRLPALAERVVHAVVCEIVILEVEIVKVITPWLYFLSLHDPNELWIGSLVCNKDSEGLLFPPSLCFVGCIGVEYPMLILKHL